MIHADPTGQHAAVGTLSPTDCYPAGPAGPYVAGCPVGPDISRNVLESLEHSVLIHADPAGQHAAVGTLSPSDCYPAGPAGLYVVGGPAGPYDYFLEPLEHSVLDHADPAGQHADVQDTVKSLEHSVLQTILDGRPMEGITCPELLECTLKLMDTTLDGGLVEKISDWEPAAHLVPDATLDGQPMEGTTKLEHSILVQSLDSRLTEGMLSLEPLEQSVLNTMLVARPMEGYTETNSPECSAPASQLDYGPSNSEFRFRTLPWTVDLWRGLLTWSVRLWGCLWTVDSWMGRLEPLEQSVLNTLSAAQPEEGITDELSDREPVVVPVPDITMDGRPMEGTTYLEHSALGCLWTVDSWRGCRVWNHSSSRFLVHGWSHDLLKYSRRRTLQSVRLWRSALASQVDYGHSKLELSARPILDINQDGNTEMKSDPSERSALATYVDLELLHVESLSRPMVNAAPDRRPPWRE